MSKVNGDVKMVESKLDPNWKQNVQLSDEESQIIILSDDDQASNKLDSPVVEMQDIEVPLPINLMLVSGALQALLYLDEPGLQLYISSDPDITSLLQCFFPNTLRELFQQNVNLYLQQMVRKDFPLEQQLQTIFTKKKFGDNEFNQYLGMTMLFGIFRLPSVAQYWHCEQFLRGGIEICMQEGRYKFIETNHMNFTEEQDNLRALQLTTEIRQKWKKMYKPDQELILYQHTVPLYTTNFLLDSETMFILDEAITFQGQSHTQQTQQMFTTFAGKNHIVYFSTDSIDMRLVVKLVHNQIYPVGKISISTLTADEESRQFLEQFKHDDVPYYYTDRVCFIKDAYHIMVHPHHKLEEQKHYKHLLQNYLHKAAQRIIQINEYKNPFSYQAVMNEQLLRDPDLDLPPIQYFKIMFEEFFEGTIYNMYSFFNCILINPQHKQQTFKQFKIDVAGSLIEGKYTQLQRDRKLILTRASLVQCDTSMQTERLSFGLPNTLHRDDYHFPFMLDRAQQVKFCIVCMKYENLSKSFFQCKLCQRQVGMKIFLCIFPCFELFHKNPNSYVHVDYQLPQNLKDDKYYKLELGFKKPESDHLNRDKLPILLPDQIRALPSLQIENKSLLERFPTIQYKNKGPSPNPFSRQPIATPAYKISIPTFSKKSVGFRRRGEDDEPIEKDFEDLINNRNQVHHLNTPQAETVYPTQHQRTQFKPIQQEITIPTPPPKPINLPATQLTEPRVQAKARKEVSKMQNSISSQNDTISTQPNQSQQYQAPQVQSEPEVSFKSPFEKFMEQVNKKNKSNRQQKLEENHR